MVRELRLVSRQAPPAKTELLLSRKISCNLSEALARMGWVTFASSGSLEVSVLAGDWRGGRRGDRGLLISCKERERSSSQEFCWWTQGASAFQSQKVPPSHGFDQASPWRSAIEEHPPSVFFQWTPQKRAWRAETRKREECEFVWVFYPLLANKHAPDKHLLTNSSGNVMQVHS